jgi:hypothetical protein
VKLVGACVIATESSNRRVSRRCSKAAVPCHNARDFPGDNRDRIWELEIPALQSGDYF